MDIKRELQSIVEWEGKLKGRRSAEDMLAFAKATLAEIERLEAREIELEQHNVMLCQDFLDKP